MKRILKFIGCLALAFAGAGSVQAANAALPDGVTQVSEGFYQSAAKYSASSDFYITSKAGFRYFADVVNTLQKDAGTVANDYMVNWAGPDKTSNPFVGKTVHLLADIDLGNELWDPIGWDGQGTRGTEAKQVLFHGNFDGGNHVISNIRVENATKTGKNFQAGLFGKITASVTIRDLVLRNVYVSNAANYCGALVGYTSSAAMKIENVRVEGDVYVKGSSFVGGLVGYCSAAGLTACAVKADTKSGTVLAGGYAGGLTGFLSAGVTVDSCAVSGLDVTSTSTSANWYAVGGVSAYYADLITVRDTTVRNVKLNLYKTNAANVGGILGKANSADNKKSLADDRLDLLENCDYSENVMIAYFDDPEATPDVPPIGTMKNAGPVIVGTGIEFDANGKVVAGLFERISDGLVAETVQTQMRDGKTFVFVPSVQIDKVEQDQVIGTMEISGGTAGEGEPVAKAQEISAAIGTAADNHLLEVPASGLSAAGKTDEGKLADKLVAALKENAGDKAAAVTADSTVKQDMVVEYKGSTANVDGTLKVTKLVYDVKPVATTQVEGQEVKAVIPNEAIAGKPIKFRMPMVGDLKAMQGWVTVRRGDTKDSINTLVGLYRIKEEQGVNVVELESDHFTFYSTEVAEQVPVAMIGEKGYMTLDEAFGAAVSGETILLLAGEHDLSAESVLKPLTGKSITLKGEVGADGKPLTKLNWGNGLKYGNTGTGDFTNTDFVFDSLEFFVDHTVAHTTYPNRNYQTYEEAIPHPRSQKYVNCVINGQICSMDDVTFDGCTFTGPTCSEDEYLVWNYKGLTVLKNCTFLGTGSKAPIKQYGIKGSQCDMEVIGCTFATVGSEKGVVTSSNGDNAPDAQGVYNGIVYGLKFDTGIVIPEGGRMVSYETGQWAAKYVTVLNGEKDANGKYVNGTLLTENRDTVEDQRARVKASSSSFMAPGFVFAIDEDGNMFIEPDPITGSGTEADPYVIKDLKGLKAFRDRVNAGNTYAGKFFVLDADIDLNNENWEPIGTAAHPYAGNGFDGQNHTISNLYIHGVDLERQGLFGKVSHDQNKPAYPFKNLTIVNVDIDLVAKDVETCGAAALIGEEFADSEVVNVKVTGSISIKAAKWAGGIVGWGLLQYTDCTVEDTTEDGGVIAAGYAVGGIAGGQGYYSVKGGKVTNCSVSNVTVLGDQRVGGLVGINSDGNHDYMSNTVQKVKLAENPDFDYSVKYTTFGKLLGCDNGQNANMPTRAIDNDVKEDTCVIPEGVMNIGGNASGVKDPAAMAIVGWNVTYDNQKKIIGGTFEQLPTGVLGEGCVMDIDPTTGKIVVLGPLVPDDQGVYHIATMQDLTVFRLMVNGGDTFGGKTVVLDNDITFAGEWDSGIGKSDNGSLAFRGIFDGNEKTIKGVKINAPETENVGFFGCLWEYGAEAGQCAVVRNLTLEGADISGNKHSGGIAGFAFRSEISNCKVVDSVIKGTYQTGSIGGMIKTTVVTGCEVSGTTVTSDTIAGGIAGRMQGGEIVNNTVRGFMDKPTATAGELKNGCGADAIVAEIYTNDGGVNRITDNNLYDITCKVGEGEAKFALADFSQGYYKTTSDVFEIARNHWEPKPEPDYYDMVNAAKPEEYFRVNNFNPVAEIAGKGPEYRYETVKKALQAAATFPGTVEKPTVVQLYPGVVSAASFTVENFELNNVVVQGSANFASILKDTAIQSDGGSSIVWKGVTFKGILWDNSHLRASVFGFEDLAFIGNKFVNLVGSESAVHFTLQGPMCKNLTFVGNVFEGGESGTAAAINCASAAIKCLTGEITITNNVFKSAPWRSFCVRVDANDGIADKVVVTDNWFDGNKSCDWVNIQGNADNVVVQYQYNVKDDNRATSSATIDGVDGDNATLIADHNYFARTPDAVPGAFYVNDYRKAGNIYDAGVYPYYNAYHKDELAAGTTTVRESLYNLVDPAAIVVNEDGKFVKTTVADAMAASKPGESVMLIRDATDEEVVIAGDVTFDKNGKNCGGIKAAEGYLLVDLGGDKYIAKSPVAEIVDGQKYDTLEKAIAAVTENQTIKMLANVALTKVLDIPADKSFTLDLNGKKISDAETGFDWSVSNVPTGTPTPANTMIVLRGTMKVCDTSANQDGSIWTDNFGYIKTKAFLVVDNGNLTLDSGTIHGEYAGCYVIGYTGDDPTHTPIVPKLTLNGGEISGEVVAVAVKGMTAVLTVNDGATVKTKDGYGISTNGTTDWYDGGNCQITINGGTIVGEDPDSVALYNPAEAIVKIKGGVLSAGTCVGIKGGNITISSNATLIATGPKAPAKAASSGMETTGDALYIEDTYSNHKPVVSVIGGMLKSANGHAVQYWTNKAADKIGSLSIAGGSLIAAKDEAAVLVGSSVGPVKFIEAQVDEVGAETGYPLFNSRIIPQYIAEGYIEKDNGNGTWTVTKGQAEIEVVIKPVVLAVETAEGMSDEDKAEGQKQAEQIKENIVAALSDPSISDIVGTGVIDATYKAPGELWGYVVDALRAEAPEGIRDQINENTDVKSHVEITFESLEVKVATEIDESSQHVVKSTLNKVTYEIKPILTTYITVGDVTTKVQTRIPSGQILANPIEFALCLEPSFVSELAKVTHRKDDQSEIDTKTYPVKRDAEKAYIQLAWNQFSFAEIEGQSVEDQVCTVNGAMYDSVATAAAAADEGAVITLLKDIPSDVPAVPLKPLQVIELNGNSFEAQLEGVAAGYELAKTPEGQAFIAPKKIEVPTSPEAGAPKIKVRIAGMTADQLKEIQPSGRPLWADIVMGADQKLIPFVPRSPIGIGTVTIKTTLPNSTFVRTAATARDGVSVKYQLKKRVGNGDFLEYGEVKDKPVFTVEADELETRTSWKIETIFDEEY